LVWDVEIIVRHLDSNTKESDISDKLLTALLALKYASQASEICQLDLRYLVKHFIKTYK